jgi:Ribosomal protein S1
VSDAVVAKILDGRLLVYMPENELYATVSMGELSWSLEESMTDFYPGQHVKVRITKKDNIEKLRASIRQAVDNPYEKCINDYNEGDVLPGIIINVVDYGAFIKLSEGVAGLLHRSEVHRDETAPNMKDIFKVGDKVKVVISRIDHEKGRILLSLKRLNQNFIKDLYKDGSIHSARITRITEKYVTLEFPYEVRSEVRKLRFAKAGIQPTEGEKIEVQESSYSIQNNTVKVALKYE